MMTAEKAYERAERGVSVVWWMAFPLGKAPSLAEIWPSLVVSEALGGNALPASVVL